MTRRRSEDGLFDVIYELLLLVPAWVGPSLAVVLFLVLRVLIPGIYGGGEKPEIGAAVAGISRGVALPIGGLVFLVWLLAEFQKWRRRRLLDAQSGLDDIRGLSWQQFEHLVGEAYRRQGYKVEESGGGGADGGVDLILRKGNETTLVQCKRWKTWKVGVKTVRELYGVIAAQDAARGVVVTCGRFTRAAASFAEGKQLELVDGPALWQLVETVKAEQLPRYSPYSPASESMSTKGPRKQARVAPTCPECGSDMVLQTARRRRNAGSPFWCCSTYPRCRGKQPLEPKPE